MPCGGVRVTLKGPLTEIHGLCVKHKLFYLEHCTLAKDFSSRCKDRTSPQLSAWGDEEIRNRISWLNQKLNICCCQIKYGDSIRRLNCYVDMNGLLDIDLDTLKARVRTLFNLHADSNPILTYIDEDNDNVALADEEDFYYAGQQYLNPMRITTCSDYRERVKSGEETGRSSRYYCLAKGYIMEPEAVIQEGPIDGSLLGYQQQHRSHAIWNNNGEPPIDCKTVVVRRNEANLKRLDPPAPPVAELVRQAGFAGLMDIPFISLDLALITALLEHWRPETHSFHLGSGEWTVTLQDVEVILGIPVDGLPVVGSTEQDWDKLCKELLGVIPEAKVSRTGGKVKLSWLRANFKGHLEAGYSEEQVRQQARGCILLLIGVWAWERFPYFAPGCLGKRARPLDAPLGAWWNDAFHTPDMATHVLGAYRHFFDLQRPDEVVWRPYDEIIENLPLNCRAGRAIWMAKVPLLCFPYVENHMPDRVMRQFGYRQSILDDCNCRAKPHGMNFKSGTKDYAVVHANSVALWNDRLNYIVLHGDVDIDVYPADDPYVVWYRKITLRYISRLGAAADIAMGFFERLRTMDVSDIEALRKMGEQGVECMRYLEKWLRKKPPIQPNLVHIEEDENLENEWAQEDDIAGGSGSISPASFESHLQALESFPFSPLLDSMNPTSNEPSSQSQSTFDGSWFESPVVNVGGAETSFLDPPLVKKRKRLDGDRGIHVGDQVPQFRVDTPTFEGHRSKDVQGKGMVAGDGSGVLTQLDTQAVPSQAHAGLDGQPLEEAMEVVTQVGSEALQPTPPIALRKGQRDTHPPDCGRPSCGGHIGGK
ncbi:hypothetical protein Vadar_010144 [Vaccinium darrowii]|uniref:Uncharacterized protein n=1 Tax=Vaccinium darrowii TaxID=229202 RepID=A0ACB7XQF6_9ERIC|nr:hypothetical protein Vadar_010144 [Vaccinium darrowii]